MEPARSLRGGELLQAGFHFEVGELQHDCFRSSRLIPVELNIASLAREERKARKGLLARTGNDFHFLYAAVISTVILNLGRNPMFAALHREFRLVPGDIRFRKRLVSQQVDGVRQFQRQLQARRRRNIRE